MSEQSLSGRKCWNHISLLFQIRAEVPTIHRSSPGIRKHSNYTMEMASIAPFTTKAKQPLPLSVLLKLNHALKKSLFSRKFYQEINDKVLSSTATLDSTLYFICYFTLLLSAILNNKHEIKAFLVSQKHKLLQVVDRLYFASFHRKLVTQATKREVGAEAVKAEAGKVEEKALPKSNLAVHLKQISSYISDIRIFHRLTEAIKYMPWIIDEFTALVNPLPVARLDRFVNLLQALNCLVLELFENVGWLTDHNWIGTSDNAQWCIETYIWSSRVWGVYLLIEIVELIRRTPVSKWNKDWRISMFTQVVQLPLVLHWSLYDGCLSPFWVGLCGSGASFFGFRKVLKTIDLS